MGELLRAVQGQPNILDAFLRAQEYQRQIGRQEMNMRLQLAQQALARMYRQQELDYQNQRLAMERANYASEDAWRKARAQREGVLAAARLYGAALAPGGESSPGVNPGDIANGGGSPLTGVNPGDIEDGNGAPLTGVNPGDIENGNGRPLTGVNPGDITSGGGAPSTGANPNDIADALGIPRDVFGRIAPFIHGRPTEGNRQVRGNQPKVVKGPDGNMYMYDGAKWVQAPGMPSKQASASGDASDWTSDLGLANANNSAIVQKNQDLFNKQMAAIEAKAQKQAQAAAMAEQKGLPAPEQMAPTQGADPDVAAAWQATRNGHPDLAAAIRNKWSVARLAQGQHSQFLQPSPAPAAPPVQPQASAPTQGKPLTPEAMQHYAAMGLTKEQAMAQARRDGYVW
jgi:hypothetical protein